MERATKDLIRKLANNSPTQRVPIIIDEYDSPITRMLEETTSATGNENATISPLKENRKVMRAFYSCMKGITKHIEFMFVTGVSKFDCIVLWTK